MLPLLLAAAPLCCLCCCCCCCCPLLLLLMLLMLLMLPLLLQHRVIFKLRSLRYITVIDWLFRRADVSGSTPTWRWIVGSRYNSIQPNHYEVYSERCRRRYNIRAAFNQSDAYPPLFLSLSLSLSLSPSRWRPGALRPAGGCWCLCNGGADDGACPTGGGSSTSGFSCDGDADAIGANIGNTWATK